MRTIKTTVAACFVAMLVATSAQAATARSLDKRVGWLQERTSYHRYVCRHGAHGTQRWHCRALVWTSRELRQAKMEQWHALPATADWYVAVRLAQRVFPGTERWLLSCSRGEGGHGRWVPYHAYGSGYYPGYERTDAVGGWMQFRPSTFRPYYRHALAYVQRKGFQTPLDVGDWLAGWRDPLAQALTAGYMRAVAGNSGWHWQASIDRGCA